MFNKVILIGRITKEIELRTSPSGVVVTNFTVAVGNRFSKEEKADFIPVVTFGKTAEFLGKYARKGVLVNIDGRLQQKTYENKEGKNVSVIEVLADSVLLLEKKTNEAPVNHEAVNTQTDIDDYTVSDDDLPF